MSNIDKQTLRIPERKKHNWGQAVMRDCDFCQQWALTVRHSDGGCICASCCDSEYTTALSSALVVALDELEAAEKRITELERNEIREEGNQFLVVRHPGKLPVVKHCAGELEGFLRQLLEHDPMATIDIVTHRYYGVGGQWGQDADEYLQMMAAAAGKGE
ncbi:ead/Ea22-like family protein [Escherichia coli]|uniref:ead/Ea22-like family protein n=1 Tax=Escherichia coli TaxID=562 RepID=UPI002815AD1B|nr:ead/Ea22-like family protein [Escherichia coli]